MEAACEPGEIFMTPELVDCLPEDTCQQRGDLELKGMSDPTRLHSALAGATELLQDKGDAA